MSQIIGMSVASVPPPPPPPSISSTRNRDNDKTNMKSPLVNNSICRWAANYPELQLSAQRNQICLYAPPALWKYTYVESILQIGPTCGLIALSMLLKKKISPEKVLFIAKELRYTNNGEMFSVKNMADLLKYILEEDKIEGLSVKHCKDGLFRREVIDSLVNGSMMLVPYDADRNHFPCCNKGHSAHWAIIMGVLITNTSDGSERSYNYRNVYVMAKHGKSLHLALWRLKDLEDSNRNLVEISEKRAKDELDYVVPDDGIDGENGLNGQFILIHKV